MEGSSERLVRLGQDATLEIPLPGKREITTVDDLAIQSTPQDLPLAAAGGICARWYHVDFLSSYRLRTFNQTIDSSTTIESDIFFCFVPLRCYSSDFFLRLKEEELKEESQRPRPALSKARPRRDPPRVSRRSSQVSPPIYLRHRFQPQSRKDSSSRRQR